MIQCKTCKKDFIRKSRQIFCTDKCKSRYNTHKWQVENGIKRKIELVKYKGGKCKECGYKKNFAALIFHHLIPKDKSFPLSIRELTNRSMDKLYQEVEKCVLLCSNCHAEEHWPQYDTEFFSGP